ncbi:MAG TPA: membrane protein insertion efficiency factor YidD [Nakamurella sp.]
MTGLRRAVRWPVLLLIRFYQRVISPWTPPSCRYYPSCSQYAYQAVERHGLVRGGWLAVRRLGRCHPWAAGGVDHVPPVREATGASDEGLTDIHSDIHNTVPSPVPRAVHGDGPAPAAQPTASSDPMIVRGA